MDKQIHHSLKIWYGETYADMGMPDFDDLTMEQKSVFAKSTSFAFWNFKNTLASLPPVVYGFLAGFWLLVISVIMQFF